MSAQQPGAVTSGPAPAAEPQPSVWERLMTGGLPPLPPEASRRWRDWRPDYTDAIKVLILSTVIITTVGLARSLLDAAVAVRRAQHGSA